MIKFRTSLIQMDQGMVRVKLSFVAAVVEFFLDNGVKLDLLKIPHPLMWAVRTFRPCLQDKQDLL